MSNEIPKSYDPVVELLEDAADGAEAHGAAVNLKQNDAAALRLALEALAGKPAGPNNVPPAVIGAKTKWNNAKAAKVDAGGSGRAQPAPRRFVEQQMADGRVHESLSRCAG